MADSKIASYLGVEPVGAVPKKQGSGRTIIEKHGVRPEATGQPKTPPKGGSGVPLKSPGAPPKKP